MQYNYFPLKIVVVLVLLHVMTVSEISSQDLQYVPGCRLLLNDFSEIVARCTKFNASSTPTSLPKNIKSLYIDGVKNLPTDIPIAPELKLTKLLMTNGNIHNISKVMFEGLESLIHLGFKKNFIKNFSSDAFINIPNLEILDLAENYILSIESIAPSLRNLKHLKHLFLYSNKLLRYLKDNDFVLLENTSLESLDISHCVIEYIESNTFKPLKSLSSLNISYNPLPEEGLRNISFSLQKDNLSDLTARALVLEASYFSCRFLRWLQTTSIVSLDLSENRFICPPKGNYKHLRSLIFNKCTFLGLISFAEMPNLDYLEIKEHQLLGIDKEFKSNTRLKFLDLSNFVGIKSVNYFKIADYAFENQNELTFLYLRDLPIRAKINRYMLHNLRKLEDLSFFKCGISAIEGNAFETLNNLVYLDLSFNSLSELSTCAFYGLISLKRINLSYNMIRFIDESHPFENMPKLEFLNLNTNKIVKFSPGEFQKLNNLGIILLSDNLIQPWDRSFLPKNPKKIVLLLDKNAISYFTTEMFDDVPNLETFDFSKNPLNCSHCSILELRKWVRNSTSFLRTFHTDEAYTCSEPDTLLGVNIVDANLTLSYCFPEEKDTLKIMFIILSPIVFIIVIIIIVWYHWSWNIKYCLFLMRLNTMKYKDNLDSGRYAFDACVFYCDADIKWIRRQLVPFLEGGNSPLRLCLPDRNFDAGIGIFDNILSAINNSRSTVIILSNKCLEDTWCLHNMQMAQNVMVEKSRSGLIVVLLEDIPKDNLKKDLQYVLRTRTCIWWTENPTGQKLFWERLRLAILRPLDRGLSAHIT